MVKKMVVDVVPELLEKIQRDFNLGISKSKKIKKIREMIDSGSATYQQANEYAQEVGSILADAFRTHIKSETLPDGHMYYNIADRILTPTLTKNHVMVTKISAEVQEQLNKSIGLGLKGIEAPVNKYRIESIINRITHEEVFDDVAWILQEPIINFTQSSVDDTIKENVDFQGGSGLYPTIARTTDADPCDWCKSLAGTYKYPNVPDDVYKRHDRCRCTVEYDPGDARKQNVWTKEWR